MLPVNDCYHCGEAVPGDVSISAHLGDFSAPMCCIGCKAVAEFIFNSGLASFYEFRDAPEVELGLKVEPSEWKIFDDPDLLQRYVHIDNNTATTTIDIGGMYCSACVWLLDNALKRWQEVDSVSINPSTRRAIIRWDIEHLKYSDLLAAISRVGFKPTPTSAGLAKIEDGEEDKTALRRLIVAAAAGMQVMMFAVALYAGERYGIEGRIEEFLRLVSLLVCLPIVAYSARPFFAAAYRGLRAQSPGMDLPVAVAIAAAFLASVRAVILGAGDIYFDSVAMFVLFLSTTRYLEMRARHRSENSSRALAQLLPETCTRVRAGQPEVISVDKVRVGDVVLIRPGDVIPVDGRVISGDLAIDESLVTGETLPVVRERGADVFAGGINRSGNATVEATLTGASTSIAEIGRLLERAMADKPPIAVLADRIASKFVTGMLLIASLTGLIWLSIDPSRAFEIVLATLVVTCPCALSLATPAALAAASSRLARGGFLLVRSRVLDVLTQNATIVFDKTGTLTAGRPVILHTTLYPGQDSGSEADYLSLAAAIETASEHVLARAFESHLIPGALSVDNVKIVQGAGISATVNDVNYRIGNAKFVGWQANQITLDKHQNDLSHVFLADENRLLAQFEIGDELRADARDAVSKLRALGYPLVISSGDRDTAVEAVARKLGIERWFAQQTPADKVDLIRDLQQQGTRVVMIGDGINDAPVLSVADSSIAIDAGTALARASADAVALGKRLNGIVEAVQVAIRTKNVIRQNVTWAILYNLLAVPLAASGLLAPWMAAIGMSVSSLAVVLNALRLQSMNINLTGPTSSRKGAQASGEILT